MPQGIPATSFHTSPWNRPPPGCTQADMEALRPFCRRELHLLPRQVQLFTLTPCTWSTLMRAGAFAGEIGGQPFAGYTEYVGFTIGFAIRIENGLVIGGPPPVFKTELGQALAVRGHHHPADGRFDCGPHQLSLRHTAIIAR